MRRSILAALMAGTVAISFAGPTRGFIGTALAQDRASVVIDQDHRQISRTFGTATRRADANRAFFEERAENTYDAVQAIAIPRPDATILQGTVIPGVLETAIQSDLPSMIRAVTSRDVYSYDGRRVLLPAGSRLIGEYSSAIALGQVRVFVIWTRAVTPDGVSVAIDSFGTDRIGRGGLGGRVDRHLLERFGSAAVLTIIGGAAEFLAGLAQQSVDGGASEIEIEARIGAAEGVGDNAQSFAEAALEDSLDIPPTIHVAQGTRIHVIVARDLSFAEFYDDPIEAEIDRILAGEH